MSLVAGREFSAQDARLIVSNVETPADVTPAPLVAVINQAMARHFFGEENPIGKRFSVERDAKPGPPIEVIGVVKDAKYSNVRERAPSTSPGCSNPATPIKRFNFARQAKR
jgi:hypothetical protein